jgi:hypothetical protein
MALLALVGVHAAVFRPRVYAYPEKLDALIIEKKQIARASIDLGKAGAEDMMAHVGQYLDALEPGARHEIEARIARLNERRALSNT